MTLLAYTIPVRSVDRVGCAVLLALVLYFDNHTADRDFDVLSKGIADMLVSDLSGVEGLQVLEREKLQDLVKELGAQRTEFFDPRTAQRLGKGLGATHAIAGSIVALSPKIRIDVRLIEVATGKVVLGDHVVGEKNDFFALEQQLVAKLVAGLAVKGGAAKSQVSDLDALLEYSRGLDDADRGDLKSASSRMAKVVKQSPDFALAKTRYTEILRKLHDAKQRRTDLLADRQEQLIQSADRFLAQGDPAKLGDRELAVHFGYRILRGQYLLHVIAKEHARSDDGARIQLRDPANAKPLLQAFFENTKTLIEEVEKSRTPPDASQLRTLLAQEDVERAGQLGIRDPGACFFCPGGLRGQLALWTAGVHWVRTMPVTRPPLARLDPSFADRAIALLDPALAAAEKKRNTGAIIGALDTKAQVLVALGRPEEAMASWQEILDRFPTAGGFEEIETKIKATLGVSKAQADLDAATAKCDGALANAFGLATMELYQYGGVARVEEKLAAVEKSCQGTKEGQQTITIAYQFALSLALPFSTGCDAVSHLAQRAQRAKVPHDEIAALLQSCR